MKIIFSINFFIMECYDGDMAKKYIRKTNQNHPAKKTTTAVKESVLEVFEKLGGVDGMLAWAQSSPEAMDKFYLIYAKLLPKHNTVDGQVNVDHSIKRVLELIDGKTTGLPVIEATSNSLELEDGRQVRSYEFEH
jgi:hypothetical protein